MAKPELPLKLISKDVKYGYSVPIPLDSVKLIPGLEMAPMNIMAQNTINEFGQVSPKDRLTTTKVGSGPPVHQSTATSGGSSCRSVATASASGKL